MGIWLCAGLFVSNKAAMDWLIVLQVEWIS